MHPVSTLMPTSDVPNKPDLLNEQRHKTTNGTNVTLDGGSEVGFRPGSGVYPGGELRVPGLYKSMKVRAVISMKVR